LVLGSPWFILDATQIREAKMWLHQPFNGVTKMEKREREKLCFALSLRE